MTYQLLIALRYLRAKRRQRTISLNTLISIAGVTLGVAALIATLAVMSGFEDNLREKILGTNAHVVIVDRAQRPMEHYDEALKTVARLPHVVAATPFIYNQVLLTADANVHGVILRGIDPATEGTVTDVERNLIDGRLADLSNTFPPPVDKPELSPRSGIVIGKELALRLGVFMGDTINVVSPRGTMGPFGMVPKLRPYQVVGVFDSGMYDYDSSIAYISLAQAQDFFQMGNAVTGVEIKVDEIFRAEAVASAAEAALGGAYWVRDWKEMNRNLFSALKLEKIIMFIILVLIILVAAFNIIGTLTMIVIEKSREIAILKAMGATRRAVMGIFMLDGLIIGGVGVFIGIPLGYLVCWGIETFYTLPADVYYISHIPIRINLFDVVLVAGSALLITFLATVYPSWQAGRLAPVEALRYE
ncbi:MAG: lipoprotein-releasing ABC transporter permease subunit [Nitrospirae bacterium]|nr:lipoprotein-releasing ABC transporter permease subunit [Nitrospirota bacterium]